MRTIDGFGVTTEYAYDRWGQVIESRVQVTNESNQILWRVTRTLYDTLGRIVLNTDPLPGSSDQALGVGTSPAVGATLTSFDANGRENGSYRASQVIVRIVEDELIVVDRGRLESQVHTEFDERGRSVRRTSIYGQVTLSEFDEQGREVAKLGPLRDPVEVGLLDERYQGTKVRARREWTYDIYGKKILERTELIQAESPTGHRLFIDDTWAQTLRYEYNRLGSSSKPSERWIGSSNRL